jgi:hypothetical protein
MATTTNYGWETPDDTDLVKDGALAMRDLGQDVDTSLFSITSGKNVGMVHITSNTFTASSDVQINSIFSSSFKNYKIVFLFTAHSVFLGHSLRFRTGGVVNSTANYNYIAETTNSASGGPGIAYARSQTIAPLEQAAVQSAPYILELDIYNPFAAEPTWYNGMGMPTVANFERANGAFGASTSFDGISLIASTGNMTGNFKVYGLKD